MKSTLKEKLLSIAKKEIEGNDSSHDFEHAIRL